MPTGVALRASDERGKGRQPIEADAHVTIERRAEHSWDDLVWQVYEDHATRAPVTRHVAMEKGQLAIVNEQPSLDRVVRRRRRIVQVLPIQGRLVESILHV